MEKFTACFGGDANRTCNLGGIQEKETDVVVHRVTHRMGYLHRLLGILLYGRFIYSSAFTYSVSHLYQNRVMGLYFQFWVIVHYIILASVFESLFSWLLYLFNIPTSLWVNFCFVLL